MQHHGGGQASSADGAQAGGGTEKRLEEPNQIFLNPLLESDQYQYSFSVSDLCPSVLQIDSEVCPQRILISNLPKMDPETLQNKLEIHFSKTKHGGGEVEDCEMLPDSGTVVLTFVKKDSEKALSLKLRL